MRRGLLTGIERDVREWWRKRTLEGCQLAHPDEFIAGWDYKGEGPWFDSVAVSALRADFVMSCPGQVSWSQFYKLFRTFGTPLRVDAKTFTLHRPDGSLFVRTSRTAAIFGPKPALDPDLDRVLTASA